MTHKLIIPGPLSGLNEYSTDERTSKYSGARTKKAETLMVAAYARIQLKPIKPPVRMRFTWYEPNRRRDPDNIAFAKKYILDGLVMAGLLPNDGQKQIKGFDGDDFEVDKQNPRVEVEIVEV